MMHLRKGSYTVCLSLLLATTNTAAEVLSKSTFHSIIRYDSIHRPAHATDGMVVSQRHSASQVGADILRQGGNAVDAAVAVGFALAVVLPRAGNIGGGGFMMIHLAETGKTISIDYRETAPSAAHTDVYLSSNGDVDDSAHRQGHSSVAVPGTVAGLTLALEKYGTMPLATVMAPAIALARDGFVMDYDTASAIATRVEMLQRQAYAKKTFFNPDGSVIPQGQLFKQAELADSLSLIAREGQSAFYQGEIAKKIVAEMQRNNGLITLEDLRAYRPVQREPVRGTYRGYDIVSMPPPSSGGAHVIQMLNVLEQFPISEMGSNSADYLHVLAATMKRAYADRSKHLGDPDFYSVPISWLTSKQYAKQLASQIHPQKVMSSADIAPGEPAPYESVDTTHFSVMDKHGNAVSNTYTLNFSFGSGIVVPGAGFLLNNEMADFSAKAGVAYAFGLLGGTANSIEPGKRPLSAMTPTIVLKEGKPWLVTGSPGGSRIISTVLQQIINVIDHKMNVASATHAARVHHQWFPDEIEFEAAVNPDAQQRLRELGYSLKPSGTMGSLQSIMWHDGAYYGSSDPRRPGAGVAGVNQ
ncbi:MAG: gamma-glutamyltransferase [Pseudomonadota bacterium]